MGGRGSRLAIVAAAVVAVLTAVPAAVRAAVPVVVEPGVVLSVSVLEEPSFNSEVRVNAAGSVVLPVVGEIDVNGRSLSEVAGLVAAELRARNLVLSPTVVVQMVRYRPVYVGGDVRRPGAIEFEPGLSVRHALILAGGTALAGSDARLGTSEILTIMARIEGVSTELVAIESRIARLRAELAGAARPDLENTDAAASAGRDASEFAEIEQGFFDDRRTERTNEEAHLTSLESLLDLEVDVLEQREVLQREEQDVQKEQLANAATLVERGLMPVSRLQELRREASRLSRDLLENRAFAARAQQTKAEVANRRANSDVNWRISIRSDLSTALTERGRLEAEVRALTAGLVAAGASAPRERGRETTRTEVLIYRKHGDVEREIAAGMGDELAPGDVIEVRLVVSPEG
jgi:polysaccharide export outer membrane protein